MSVNIGCHGRRLRLRVKRARTSWSLFPKPGEEAFDALSVLDWPQSVCLACGLARREVLYMFPPLPLLRRTIAKACADQALCALVVTVAPLWHKLLVA